MKKGKWLYIVAWIVAVAVVTVIAFLLPDAMLDPETTRFWIIYSSVLLSFLGQAVCSLIYASKVKKQERFLMIPVVILSYIVLLVTFLFALFALMNPLVPEWLLAIVVLGILAIYALSIIRTLVATELVMERGEQVNMQTGFMYGMTAQAKALEQTASVELKTCVRKVYDSFRYSDPVSDKECIEIETRIREAYEELCKAVETREKVEGEALAEQVCALINERNVLVKGRKR